MITEEPKIELLLLDVLRGYSKIEFKSEFYYLKHFSVFKSLQLDEYESECLDDAIKKGIKSQDQLLDLAISRKSWSSEEEAQIKNLKWLIDKSEAASSKIVDAFAKKSFEDSISKQKEELQELESRRFSLIAHSAESFATRKRNYKEIKDNLFQDVEMKESVSEDTILRLMHLVRLKISEINNQKNIIKMAYNSLYFDTYCLMYRQPNEMIGKNLFNITIWQKDLLTFSSLILNKLKNYDIPNSILEDPLAICKYKPKEENSGHAGNVVTHGMDDLRAKMAEKGGKLTAEDF